MTWGHLHVTRKAVSSDLLLPVTWQSGKEKRYGILIRLFASVLTRIVSCFLSIFKGHNSAKSLDRMRGVVIYVLSLTAVDIEFESRSSQTKDYNIVICCFSAKHTALSGATCLPVRTVVSVNVELLKNGHNHHHLIEILP
jgi:hypothetical protein